MKKSCSDEEVAEALNLYENSTLSSQEIADKFNVSPASLTAWAKKARKKLRGRGRHKFDEPTPKQQVKIRMAHVHGYTKTGHRYNRSKQSVYNVCKRWRNWPGVAGVAGAVEAPAVKKPLATSTPKPGDVLQYRDKILTVVSNDSNGGGIAYESNARGVTTGKRLRVLSWAVRGRWPKKIGHVR